MDFGAVNRAVVAYLSETGERGSTFAGPQELLQRVRALVRESLAIPAHWDTTSAVVGAALMKREMKRRHDELDEPALDALAANFAAAWR